MAGQQEQMYYERRHVEEESINKNVEDYATDQVKERGIFDVLGGKKEEEQKLGHDHQVIVTDFENTYLWSDEGVKEGEKPNSTEKLHRSHSTSSTSSSDEEEGEGGDKSKKKEKKKAGIFKDAVDVHRDEYNIEDDRTAMNGAPAGDHSEEKKGFIEKIKEKLPGAHHKGYGEENN
ncbi:hypothetical protein Scep_020069 [Stephania cephalantha]|uniref:Dehydrin n=1 Tax=Stephania cephalantha TaxID=152367 RepID=A0AAP0IC39_9MAGN